MTHSNLNNNVVTNQVPNSVLQHQLEEHDLTVKYVVVRNGTRVSDRIYTDDTINIANSEKTFWKNVIKKWPDGSKVELVVFDKKKHRIW